MDGLLAPLRILLVEDHHDTAEVLARLLEMRGFRVMVATTVAAALNLARCLPFDVLLCDIQLPDGDGCQLLSTLRQEVGMDALVAIAFSGHGEPATIQRARQAGFDGYVLKPVEINKFFGFLEEVCRAPGPYQSHQRDFITLLEHRV